MTAHRGKFIAYYRVSTDKQGKSGLGLEAQRQAVETYLNGGSWTVRPTKRKGGSPPDSGVTWIMRVRVLVALDALRSSMTQEKATSYINSEYPKLRRLMSRGRHLPGTIKRWRRELEEAKQGTFLAIFAQLMIDMEEELKNRSSSRPMNSDRWRQIASS